MSKWNLAYYEAGRIKSLLLKIIRCHHDNLQLGEKLKLTEKRLEEVEKKHEIKKKYLEKIRETCSYKDQCPLNQAKYY